MLSFAKKKSDIMGPPLQTVKPSISPFSTDLFIKVDKPSAYKRSKVTRDLPTLFPLLVLYAPLASY